MINKTEIGDNVWHVRLDLAKYNEEIERWSNKALAIPIWVYALLLAVGICLNVLNIVVFTRPSMRSAINLLLSFSEGANILVFVSLVPTIFLLHNNRIHADRRVIVVRVLSGAAFRSAMFFSSWITVTVSVFRLVAVTWPLSAKIWCSSRHAAYTIVCIFSTTVVVFVVFWLTGGISEYRYEVFEDGGLSKPLFNSSWFGLEYNRNVVSKDVSKRINNVLILFGTFVPYAMTSITTVLLLINLWRAKVRRNQLSPASSLRHLNSDTEKKVKEQRTEERITSVLILTLVLLTLACVRDSLFSFEKVFLTKQHKNNSFIYQLLQSRVAIIVCNALTFFVYCGLSENFRFTLVKLFSRLSKFFKVWFKHGLLRRASILGPSVI